MTGQIRRLLRATFYFAAMLVAVLSLAPSTALPPVSIGDKAEHVVAYVVLALLGATSSERGIARTILGLSVFGGAIELLQALSPGRSPDALDAAADIAGACIGCGLAAPLRRMVPVVIERTARRR